MAENTDKTIEKGTEWNQAIAFHERIDEVCRYINYMRIKRDYESWFDGLVTLEDSLSAWRTQTEKEELKKLFEKSKMLLNSSRVMNVDKSMILDVLREYQACIFSLLRKRGMDLPKKKDIMDLWKDLREDDGTGTT